ncbi:glycosyl transferase 2 family protein [Nocardiopsis alba ATCC BAA-2165]|uniref:Glycosyl transferase 2 family protein n=1 Tax=Nocardiopsis alba (strain ATCC BAA-2165 / BE74) TaxID=1205910 RepID=J7LB78_NOCAA|nr:glycosyl transferase 2 family protein [Nocardiopsis alba ATCC BAA-2165]
MPGKPTLSCVLLTMGTRPAELRRAITSVFEQEGADVEVIVVGNGADLPELPENVVTVRLPENLGIPEGRNHGVRAAHGDVILFLDDDGWYRSMDLARHVRDRFAEEPRLGALSFRIADPDGGPDQRRHVPRLRAGGGAPPAGRAWSPRSLAGRAPSVAPPSRRAAASPASSSTPMRRPTWPGGSWTPATPSSTTPTP